MPAQITIQLTDGRGFHPSAVATDPESDLAILTIDGANNLPTATLGNNKRVLIPKMAMRSTKRKRPVA